MIGEVVVHRSVGITSGNALAVEEDELFCDVAGEIAFSQRPTTPIKRPTGLLYPFAIAIIDANDIWSCGGDPDFSGQYLYYKKDKVSGALKRTHTGDFRPCGRWDSELPKLDAAYNLDAYSNDGSAAVVRIDFALKNIFKVCADTFAILESPQ